MGKALGEGSFGKVCLGTHSITGEHVAIKVLEKSRLVQADDVRRVSREIQILKKNRHRNVVQLFEVLDTPNSICLIMENCDAGEMFSYIVKHKRVHESQACLFFQQIVDGVDYLHSVEVTHRDLKPENLLLQTSKTHGFVVKIVDFGLSNTHDGGKLLQTACGSPCYAAPEMIAGKMYWGPKADVWSMGVILFALVCGYLPFEDSNTAKLYDKILAGEYSTPNWISVDVRDLISKILNTDPEFRYDIDQIRNHPWFSRVAAPALPSFAVEARDVEDDPTKKLIVLDKLILEQVINHLSVDQQVVADALASETHNAVTTTYHLLAQRHFLDAVETHTKKNTLSVEGGIDPPVAQRETVTILASTIKPKPPATAKRQASTTDKEQPSTLSNNNNDKKSNDETLATTNGAGHVEKNLLVPPLNLSSKAVVTNYLNSQTVRETSANARPISADCRSARLPTRTIRRMDLTAGVRAAASKRNNRTRLLPKFARRIASGNDENGKTSVQNWKLSVGGVECGGDAKMTPERPAKTNQLRTARKIGRAAIISRGHHRASPYNGA